MPANTIPCWLPCGEHGAVLKDATGLVYGSVRRHDQATTLWLGTAIFGPEIAKLPGFLRGDPRQPGEPVGARSFNYPVTAGACQYAPSKEKAMQFVVDTLTEHGRM